MIKARGNHILVDYTGFKGDEYELGNFVFNIMIDAVEKTEMKIVHKKLVILNSDTPPGFTSILLLDESHFSSHCYSDEGLLALDIFTCGATDTQKIIDYVNIKLFEKCKDLKCTYLETHKRFNF